MMNLMHKTLLKTPNFLKNPSSSSSSSSSSTLYSSLHSFSINKQETQIRKNDDDEKSYARPSQIPYQSKVANCVNMIGTVKMPVEFLTAGDGKAWAATVLSQEQYSSNLPLLWVPVIFEGDLAHTAATHLKEHDIVYVAGHLSPEPLPINLTNDQVNVQVLVHDLHFVRGLDAMRTHVHRLLSRKRKS